jgi:hypothetical protein
MIRGLLMESAAFAPYAKTGVSSGALGNQDTDLNFAGDAREQPKLRAERRQSDFALGEGG